MEEFTHRTTPAIEAAAARWLARRDRTLTAKEQDDYLQWLREDPRHAAAVARQETTLGRLMQLGEWQSELQAEPNPDLFAPRPRRRSWGGLLLAASTLVATAAVIMVMLRTGPEQSIAPVVPKAEKSYLRVNERHALSDGSVVELKDGSRFTVEFSPGFRRIHLTGGEAYFTVAKDPNRPFIVEAAGMEVRAVGTVFNVRLDPAAVEVLVTEGKVKLSTPTTDTTKPVPLLAAGERAILPLNGAGDPQLAGVTAEQIREALSWQTPRLQFYETPLREAVEEFNRHAGDSGAPRILIGQTALGDRRIGGTFRIDNREGFVRLLEITLDVRSRRQGNGDVILFPAH
ncbi:MAG: FecR domain-containing protein [Verrucomicrobia bacterium]|nr:FecR domain-containing protein [Verrucomicrobiota bacterium]